MRSTPSLDRERFVLPRDLSVATLTAVTLVVAILVLGWLAGGLIGGVWSPREQASIVADGAVSLAAPSDRDDAPRVERPRPVGSAGRPVIAARPTAARADAAAAPSAAVQAPVPTATPAPPAVAAPASDAGATVQAAPVSVAPEPAAPSQPDSTRRSAAGDDGRAWRPSSPAPAPVPTPAPADVVHDDGHGGHDDRGDRPGNGRGRP